MKQAALKLVRNERDAAAAEAARLDGVFSALSDPVRREILNRLDGHDLLVSEVAARFSISLQAISRHIQVLVRAGLVKQERTGRISRCRLDAGPIFEAAVWLNRYSKYWQAQFDLLASVLGQIDKEHTRRKSTRPARSHSRALKRVRGRKRQTVKE